MTNKSAVDAFYDSRTLLPAPGSDAHEHVRLEWLHDFLGHTERIFLDEADLDNHEAEISRHVFSAIRSAAVCGIQERMDQTSIQTHLEGLEPPRRSLDLSSAIIAINAILFISIALELTVFSLALTLLLGVTSYLAVRGTVYGRSINMFFKSKPDASDLDGITVINNVAAHPTPFILDDLEQAIRQIDWILVAIRSNKPPEKQTKTAVMSDRRSLQFLQDIAEASATEDGDYLMKLTREQLLPFARGFGLQLIAYSDENQSSFIIDKIFSEKDKGATVTIRPAIMCQEECLATGYARAYV